MTTTFLKKTPDSAVLLWVAICLVAIVKFVSISHDRTFQYDEWNFVMNRWQFNPDTFYNLTTVIFRSSLRQYFGRYFILLG